MELIQPAAADASIASIPPAANVPEPCMRDLTLSSEAQPIEVASSAQIESSVEAEHQPIAVATPGDTASLAIGTVPHSSTPSETTVPCAAASADIVSDSLPRDDHTQLPLPPRGSADTASSIAAVEAEEISVVPRPELEDATASREPGASSAAAEGASEASANFEEEFLAALPEDIRQEILRARQHSAPPPPPVAQQSLSTLNPEVRFYIHKYKSTLDI